MDPLLNTLDGDREDSKNAYDALKRSESSGLQKDEKRTSAELFGIKERVTDGFVDTRWIESDQEIADGLSKPFAYEQFFKVLRLGRWSICFSPEVVSAKRTREMFRSLL